MADLDLDAIASEPCIVTTNGGTKPLVLLHVDKRDALVAEVRRLRADNARLDAICWVLNQHTPTVVDAEFGFRLFGRACEHPSRTGDRCDACGWTEAWEASDG